MKELIEQLRKNHSQFDVLWNKLGTDTQKHMVKTAPELHAALGEWYNKSNELIFSLEEKIDENDVILSNLMSEEEDVAL